MNFFTSDWHLGDPRLDILRRPFDSPEEMAEHIVREHNKIVGPEDTIYVIGDAFTKTAFPTGNALERMNGIKILIKGNHDVHADKAYVDWFDVVVPDGGGIELEIDGIDCWLTHYPTQSRADKFNLVGHVHGIWRVAKNALNVGVDVHHFRPLSEKDVRFFFDANCKYYDDDAWIFNHSAMTPHNDRGQTGSYFKP